MPTPTVPAPVPEREAWSRWIVGWHLAFWALVGLAGIRLLIGTDLTDRQRATGAGVVVTLALGYLLLVQRNWASDPAAEQPRVRRARYAYLCLVTVVTGFACGIDANLSMLLFIAYPQTWMLVAGRRSGAVFTTAITLAALAGFLARYGATVAVLREVGPQLLVSLLFSLLLGLWISRVVQQSRERAELITALEATRSELAAADHAAGVLAERERMSREIHDTLAQGFTSIVMLAQAAAAALPSDPGRTGRQLGQIEDVARENLAEARALVAALAPVGLDGRTLADALRRLVERFSTQTGIPVDLRLGEGTGGLTRPQEVVVLRTAQEALTNVRRHAHARRVSVTLLADEQGVRAEVGDDGVGFGPQAAGSGFGLAGIRGRVSEVGGRLDVDSSPGGGTRVTVRLPRTEEAAG
ncbi:MAG TPA: sensor histidine kinase [Kineosporiaceae bacterium]|nr:sensor histidine kinase [Kineosporiaceae bacterium]